MIEVFEINGDAALSAAKRFNTDCTDLDRLFLMVEGEYGGDKEPIGLGVLGLERGIVAVKQIITGKPFNYFDLLARSLLSILRDMPNIKIRIKNPNPYFYRFGFKDIAGYQEIISDNINLAGTCGGH